MEDYYYHHDYHSCLEEEEVVGVRSVSLENQVGENQVGEKSVFSNSEHSVEVVDLDGVSSPLHLEWW